MSRASQYIRFGSQEISVPPVMINYKNGKQQLVETITPKHHLKVIGGRTAIKFKTNTFPHRKIGHPEEINWDRDVSIIGAEIIKVSDALNMLKNNKPNLKENDGYSIEYTK